MRHNGIAIVALVVAASPAVAQRGIYVGLDGGATLARDIGYDVTATRVQTVPTGNGLRGQTVTTTNTRYGNGLVADQKAGVDVDAVAGYDLGILRLEGEFGYKRSRIRQVTASSFLLNDTNTAPISGVSSSAFLLGTHTRVLSGMGNVLLNYHLLPRVRVFGGGGGGHAWVRSLGDRDDAWAFQGLAGAAVRLVGNLEVGVKYRYFQTGNLDFRGSASFANAATGATSVSQFAERGKFRSNSLLVSLTYGLGGILP